MNSPQRLSAVVRMVRDDAVTRGLCRRGVEVEAYSSADHAVVELPVS